MHPNRLTLIALALSLAFGPSFAKEPAQPPAAVAKAAATAPAFVREMGGIEEYRLANGLQVLLFPDEAQSTTTVNITYRVGSRQEAQGEYGMAHLLEHLMFKGTPKHKDVATEFAQKGMRFNGTTTADRTNYFASFNADPATLDFALSLEADRMLNSFIAKADLDKEMTVVRNEFERGENEPFQVLSKRVQAVAYDWNAYGHATIGPKSDIENVPIEKLQAFYHLYYRPDNATLMVAGRFDKAATLKRIQALFAKLPNPKQPVPQPYTVEPAQDGERTVVVRRVGGQPALLAAYHIPAMAQQDTAPLLVLGLLMSLEPSGQLYKELVEPKLALSASLGGLGGIEPGLMRAFAVLPPDADEPAVEKKFLDLIEGRGTKPFTEEELARVRELALLSYRDQMKNPQALIQQISGLGAGDWRLLFQLMEDLPKVTLADVDRVRQAYLRPANRTLGRYLPATSVERVEIPPAPPLAQRLADLKGPPKVEQGERFDPTPEHLAERTKVQKLPSGIELSTLRKQTRGNTVDLDITLRWGERNETFKRHGTNFVGDLMPEGSAHYDKQQLADALQRLKASMNISSSDQGLTVNIDAEKDTLPEVLKIAADVLQQPLLPQAAFDRMKNAGLAGLEGSRQDLETLRREAVRGYYNTTRGVGRDSPDYIRSVDEQVDDLKATTLDDVKRFYADYVSANDVRVSAVGALPDGLDTQIEQLFGAWKKPAAAPFVRYESKATDIPAKRFDAVARDKANAQMRMQLEFPLNRKDPDYLALLLANHVFGGGGMESRISTRVRREEGLSYGVGSSLSVPRFGTQSLLVIGGSFAPQNRDKVIAVVQEQLQRMADQGITAEELARAKHDIAEGNRQSRARDSALAGALLNLSDEKETWADVARRDAAMQAVTLEQANAAWKRHVKADGFVISTVGDFKN
ncbi:pitrilysin family protein [Paucibacter sp. R3-3]|uniref:Pitrilysin family protein n=1 Tax=Roseateles agri TaxID=3098619 RepID=A0ABU5D9C7_9BURK|nr:pitrilysin family protein [Paucibacter sp. R3-3]MDY0742879.1 pitrilysin family protein [Paucibacter sp. R3-3]